jgi:hypothetical protein
LDLGDPQAPYFMSSLADLPDLVGFFSYSNSDDKHSDGALSLLRERIRKELRMQLGRELRLWQDTEAIPLGALWEGEIGKAITESAFFIPIVSPSLLNSDFCIKEFEAFLAREAELGRNDLVFPILYIPVPGLMKPTGPVVTGALKILRARQYADWTDLRLDSPDSPVVKRNIARFCEGVASALRKTWESPEERHGKAAAESRRQAVAASRGENTGKSTIARVKLATGGGKETSLSPLAWVGTGVLGAIVIGTVLGWLASLLPSQLPPSTPSQLPSTPPPNAINFGTASESDSTAKALTAPATERSAQVSPGLLARTARVALVIGNNSYANLPATAQLLTAVNDAHAVGRALRQIGFDVVSGENLSRRALVQKLDEATRRLSPGDTAFFFYSGHGVAVDTVNYVLPADIPDLATGRAGLVSTAVSEGDIRAAFARRGALVVMVFDACRNNPLAVAGRERGLQLREWPTAVSDNRRGIGPGRERGLVPPPSPTGVFTIYSASQGEAALDRLSDDDTNPNSVFTRVLVPALTRPGLDLAALAITVRDKVTQLAKSVGHVQRPSYYDETTGGRIFLAGP